MIESGWPFVGAAYVIALGAVGGLSIFVALNLRYWAQKARELEDRS